ncbi:MAG TPA: hypothetical protein VEA59_00220 [Patescibacteria group bacterium]|nr:hypothetical protein [Patescibacteria group bacterium]
MNKSILYGVSTLVILAILIWLGVRIYNKNNDDQARMPQEKITVPILGVQNKGQIDPSAASTSRAPANNKPSSNVASRYTKKQSKPVIPTQKKTTTKTAKAQTVRQGGVTIRVPAKYTTRVVSGIVYLYNRTTGKYIGSVQELSGPAAASTAQFQEQALYLSSEAYAIQQGVFDGKEAVFYKNKKTKFQNAVVLSGNKTYYLEGAALAGDGVQISLASGEVTYSPVAGNEFMPDIP